VRRAHLEEDTGKSIHDGNYSLIDLNRAGVPLLEIVTEPDIHSAEAAEAFARKLRAILQYLGVNNGDMSKGVMRVEPNISVKHKDDTGYRTRTEVKNLNSIRSLFRAIEYETERQVKAWERGDGVRQATMGWDEAKQRTVVQRREWVETVRGKLPELPDAKRERFMALGLTAYDASVLVADKDVAGYFEAVITAGANAKAAANWIVGNLFSLSNRDGVEREAAGERVSAANMAMLIQLVGDGSINKATGVEVLAEMWETGNDPASIVEAKGLAQISDSASIESAIAEMLAANADMVHGYLTGKDKLFGALMGKAMAELKGKGNPAVVKDALTRLLEAKRG
jgi:aspartyl-tRNA(Asn)/glutamyl-tRNA(Gln) amidotransferase subunit B